MATLYTASISAVNLNGRKFVGMLVFSWRGPVIVFQLNAALVIVQEQYCLQGI